MVNPDPDFIKQPALRDHVRRMDNAGRRTNRGSNPAAHATEIVPTYTLGTTTRTVTVHTQEMDRTPPRWR